MGKRKTEEVVLCDSYCIVLGHYNRSNPKNNPDLRRIKYVIHNETWENRMECET